MPPFPISSPRPIAFVHIPKTAGRSVVHAFEQALGAERCTPFAADPGRSFADACFAAGHLQLCQIPTDVFAFTFLRDPIAQLASHLSWLDRYNLDVFWEERLPFSADLMTVIRKVGDIDFRDAGSLAAFFAWLPENAPVRLVNVQCNVLTGRPDEVQSPDHRVLARRAIENLGRLDFVGVVQWLPDDLATLFRMLELPGAPLVTWQNTLSSPRRLNLRDVRIRQVLEDQVLADLLLYWHVVDRRYKDRGGKARALGWLHRLRPAVNPRV